MKINLRVDHIVTGCYLLEETYGDLYPSIFQYGPDCVPIFEDDLCYIAFLQLVIEAINRKGKFLIVQEWGRISMRTYPEYSKPYSVDFNENSEVEAKEKIISHIFDTGEINV